MYSGSSYRTLKLLGIFYRVSLARVLRAFSRLQLRCAFYGVWQVHLHSVWQLVRNCLAQSVRPVERQFLYPRHVFYRVLGCHCCIGDYVGTVFCTIFVHHPSEHLASPVIVKVGINIRQRDSVWVQETLKQQVIFQWVYLSYAQAIGNHRAGSRATARADHHTKFVACGVDKVLHNQEVAWETHCLHHMQLKLYAVTHVLRQWVAITLLCTVKRQFAQIISLKFYAVYLVISAKVVDTFHRISLAHHVFPILVRAELLVQILFREFLTPLLFRAK